MKKQNFTIIAVAILLLVLLSACTTGPRAVGTPGLSTEGETVYVTYQQFVYAMDVTAGDVPVQKWTFPSEPNNKIIMYAPVEVTDDAIYVGDLANNFRKLNKTTGTEEWVFEGAKGWYVGKAAVADQSVIAPNADRNVYSIDKNTKSGAWQYSNEHPFWAQPLIVEDKVFLGSMDSRVYALNLSNGESIPGYETTLLNGAVLSAPAYDADLNMLFVGTLGRQFYALDATTGKVVWSFPQTDNIGSIWNSPILHDNQVIFVDEKGTIFSLNKQTGESTWQIPSVGTVKAGLLLLDDGFVVALEDGNVRGYQFDGKPSDILYKIEGNIETTPVYANDHIFIAAVNSENLLYSYNFNSRAINATLDGKNIPAATGAWQTIIVRPFTNVLLLITAGVKNFGLAIILFTLLIKLVTYPLTAKSLKSTRAMQDLQSDPRYKKMMAKYKDDKERLAQEQMKLYKELGINPMGSCLPTLIQLPVIFGLYQSITKAMAATPYELLNLERTFYSWLDPAKILPLQNKFLWMDLGQPERLNIGTIGIPVLAIIVVITTFLQSKLTQPPSTNPNDQAAAMTKSMNIYMPLLMGWMAYSLASGLALYFLVSNLASIGQYALQGKLDWSNVIPGMKKSTPQAPIKPVILEEDDEEDEEAVEPVKASKPSARASVKQQRPKMKKK